MSPLSKSLLAVVVLTMRKKYQISDEHITDVQHKKQLIKDYRVGLNVHQWSVYTSLVFTAILRSKPT